MKLSIVSTMAESPWGGSEELWAALAIEAASKGWQVETCLAKFEAHHTKRAALLKYGISINTWTYDGVIRLNTCAADEQHKAEVSEENPYKKILNQKPDLLVISHGGLMDIVNGHLCMLSWLWSTGVPYVVIIQANTETYWPNDWQRSILRNYLACALEVIFVSRQNLEIASRQLNDLLPNSVVWQQPVNLNSFEAIEWPTESLLQLASVARLDVLSKGQDMLLDVLSRPKWRDRKWKLNLYGIGPSAGLLKEMVLTRGIGDRVQFHGQISDISQIWRSNHILIMPSRIEGTPLALLEALMCGRPVVASDIGGCADWLIEGKTGFIARSQRVEDLTEALEALWLNKNNLAQMGKAAELFMNQSFVRRPGDTLLKYITWKLSEKPKVSAVSVKSPILTLIRIVRGEKLNTFTESVSIDSDIELVHVIADSSAENAARYNQRIIHVPLNNLAVLANAGLLAARGEYALILNDNESLPLLYINKVVAAIKSNSSVKLWCSKISETLNQLPDFLVFQIHIWRSFGGFPASSEFYFKDWFWQRLTIWGFSAKVAESAEISEQEKATSRSPRISVVITCYNYSRYLERCVDSVLAQSFRDFEVVIINDGSTDITEIVANWISQLHPNRIRIHHQANSGQPAISRNTGISLSRGDFILPLDADDWLAPSMLGDCAHELNSDPSIGVAYTDSVYCTEVGEIQLHSSGEFSVNALREGNRLNYCSMYRKSVWSELGGYRTNVRGYEDWDFWLAAAAAGFTGRRISKPLFFYRLKNSGVYSEAIVQDQSLRSRIISNNPRCFSRDEVDLARWRLLKESVTDNIYGNSDICVSVDIQSKELYSVSDEGESAVSVKNPLSKCGHSAKKLAQLLFLQGRWLDCAKACQKVLLTEPDNLEVLIILGDSLLKRHEPKQAIEIYRKALSLAPSDADVKGRIQSAVKYCP